MSRLPSLGPRGEGWVVLQLVLIMAIVLAGVTGPAWDGALRTLTVLVGAALFVAGVALILRAQADLGRSLSPFPRPRPDGSLVQTGAYRLVRHPIYAGLLLAGAGWGLAGGAPLALLATLALFVVLDLKSRREEAWLLEQHPDYEAYRRHTRRLIPGLY